MRIWYFAFCDSYKGDDSRLWIWFLFSFAVAWSLSVVIQGVWILLPFIIHCQICGSDGLITILVVLMDNTCRPSKDQEPPWQACSAQAEWWPWNNNGLHRSQVCVWFPLPIPSGNLIATAVTLFGHGDIQSPQDEVGCEHLQVQMLRMHGYFPWALEQCPQALLTFNNLE